MDPLKGQPDPGCQGSFQDMEHSDSVDMGGVELPTREGSHLTRPVSNPNPADTAMERMING